MKPRLRVEISLRPVPSWSYCSRLAPRPRSARLLQHLRVPRRHKGPQLPPRRQPRQRRGLRQSPWLVRLLSSTRSLDPSWLPARTRASFSPQS